MRVFCYYDVSGSVSLEMLKRFFNEAYKRKTQLGDNVEWLEFCFDCLDVWAMGDLSDIRRGGGSDLRPALNHWNLHKNDGDAIVIFTDGYVPKVEFDDSNPHSEIVVIQ